jgi:hypothetical protein
MWGTQYAAALRLITSALQYWVVRSSRTMTVRAPHTNGAAKPEQRRRAPRFPSMTGDDA